MLDGNRAGVTPVEVQRARAGWEERAQRDPVLWRFKAFPPRLVAAVSKLAKRLEVHPSDVQLMPSLRHAVATVLRSIPWVPGDGLLVFGHAAMGAMASHLTRRHGVRVHSVTLREPVLPGAVAAAFDDCLALVAPRVCVLPHVYATGAPLPLADLVALCQSRGVVLVVDGSDAVGNLPNLHMAQAGADFYVSRLDGYMFCTEGTAALYTNPRRQAAVATLTVSYYYGKGYADEWTYTGLTDQASWLAVTQGLQFRKYICAGYEDYIHALAKEAHCYLCAVWRVQPLSADHPATGIFAVPLPTAIGTQEADAQHCRAVLAAGGVHVGIVPLVFADGGRRLAVRVACQVYNDMADMKQLACAVLEHAVRCAS
jgi:isopenicillin-N epimerase